MGVGEAEGEGRVIAAARRAMEGPLMTAPMNGASSVLYCIESGEDIGILEMTEAVELIAATAREDANIVWGQGIDPSMGDKVRFTLIATGFSETPSDSVSNPDSVSTFSGAEGVPEKRVSLTPGNVVSEHQTGNIFKGIVEAGADIPTALRRRKK